MSRARKVFKIFVGIYCRKREREILLNVYLNELNGDTHLIAVGRKIFPYCRYRPMLFSELWTHGIEINISLKILQFHAYFVRKSVFLQLILQKYHPFNYHSHPASRTQITPSSNFPFHYIVYVYMLERNQSCVCSLLQLKVTN